MSFTESDKLDIEKKKLEIQKLKNEVGTEKLFPTRIFAFWQAIFPSIVTLLSVAGTILILYKTKFFENANTLYEIKNRELKAEQVKLVDYKNSLDFQVNLLKSTILRQQKDSSKLSDSIRIYKLNLDKYKGSASACQSVNANLEIENGNLKKQLARERILGGSHGSGQTNSELQDKISSMRSRIHDFENHFSQYEYELKTNPSPPPSIQWLRRELDWLVLEINKPEAN